MFLVIAQKRYMYGDEVEVGDFDFQNPVATYDDPGVAREHARAHTMNHGVTAIVVHKDDLNLIKTFSSNPQMLPLASIIDDAIKTKQAKDAIPTINVWQDTRQGKPN